MGIDYIRSFFIRSCRNSIGFENACPVKVSEIFLDLLIGKLRKNIFHGLLPKSSIAIARDISSVMSAGGLRVAVRTTEYVYVVGNG